MYTKRKSKIGRIVLSLMFVGILSVSAGQPPQKTYKDYPEWEMLPDAVDFEDEEVERAFQRLIEKGEAAHEGLLAIVRECEETRMARRALGILRATRGDKRKVAAELKEVLVERLPTATGVEEWLMTDIAAALADMGDEADMEALVPMLSHPELRVRIIGAWCLGKRGGLQSKAALEEAMARDPHPRMQEEFGKAIADIESRLAEKEAAAHAEPAPSP